jgi:hypothetical protein
VGRSPGEQDKGTVVVRVAGGFGDSQANKDDLAVGVFCGRMLKEYSSLDLVKGPEQRHEKRVPLRLVPPRDRLPMAEAA